MTDQDPQHPSEPNEPEPAPTEPATAGPATSGRGEPVPVHPEIVTADAAQNEGSAISQPTRLIRMASMTRAMLEEVRRAPPDEAGRTRLLEIHENSLDQLRDVLSDDLKEELDTIFLPLRAEDTPPSESELRIAQAQLVGWLEGLFHGIQASLVSQQVAAQAQLSEMQARGALEPGPDGDGQDYPGGVYL